ncbi:MAG: MFS transporter [Streptococcaceae bacterium]|jgi:MFS family permease|nr:MFS transporter [Streptococcaceae bacterium]
MKKEKLWTETFVVNMLLNFIFLFVFYLLTVIIGSVAMKNYHAPASLAGMLSGIFVIGSFVGRLWTGQMLSKWGKRKMLFLGATWFLVFLLGYYLLHNIYLLLIVRLFHGVGFGIAQTASGTVAGTIVPKSRRGEGIGYYSLSVTLASALGPFLSIFLYNNWDFTAILHLSSILLFMSIIGIFFLKLPKETLDTKKRLSFKFSQLFEKNALPIAFVALLTGVAFSSILSFLAGYTQNIQLVQAGSTFFVVYAIFILISRPITGRLFDAKGDNIVLYPVFVLFALGLFLIASAHSTVTLLISAAIIGLGFGSFSPFGQAIAIRLSKANNIGSATSTFFGLMDIGVGVGPFILGALLPLVGYRNLYFIVAIFTLSITFIYHLLHGRKQK